MHRRAGAREQTDLMKARADDALLLGFLAMLVRHDQRIHGLLELADLQAGQGAAGVDGFSVRIELGIGKIVRPGHDPA